MINYTDDILPFYLTNVVVDPAYAAIPADFRDQASERKILTLIEVLRALMGETRTSNQASLLHQCVGKMVAAIAESPAYTDITVRAIGNIPNVWTVADTGMTVSVTTVSGTDAVVLTGSYLSMDDLVTDINTQLVTAVEVEAYAETNNRLGFRNTSGNLGVTFSLAAGAGPVSLLNVAGFEAGTFVNPAEKISQYARDAAISVFTKFNRPPSSTL